MEIRVKSNIITAEDWLRWRREGRSTKEIAEILGVSCATVRKIAAGFREAGCPDPMYGKTRKKTVTLLDAATEVGSYVPGVLWGIGFRTDENEFLIGHRDSWFISLVNNQLNIKNKEQIVYFRTEKQYRLKISSYPNASAIFDLLLKHGWADRNAPVRPYPSGPLDDRGFIRAWVELHASADEATIGQRRTVVPRLRVYGNEALLSEMNLIISENTGLKPRKLQKTVNKTTKALYYYGRSFTMLYSWLYSNAAVTNKKVKKKFETE